MAFKLALTKKSDADLAPPPVWHPNFRNFERLPDTKVVRTTFFVNTAAIATTLCLLLWLGYREYHLYSLGEQIADAQKQIDSNMRQNNEALHLTKIFADEEKKLVEAVAFQRAIISPTEIVTLLGQSLPKEISIESVDAHLAEPGSAATAVLVNMKGLVAGTPDQASGAISSYVDMLRAHKRLGTVFDSITLNSLPRGSSTSYLPFDISLKTKEKK